MLKTFLALLLCSLCAAAQPFKLNSFTTNALNNGTNSLVYDPTNNQLRLFQVGALPVSGMGMYSNGVLRTFISASGNSLLSGLLTLDDLLLSGATAGTLPVLNGSKHLISLANGSGLLTNDGLGGFGYSTNLPDVTINNFIATNLQVINSLTVSNVITTNLTVLNNTYVSNLYVTNITATTINVYTQNVDTVNATNSVRVNGKQVSAISVNSSALPVINLADSATLTYGVVGTNVTATVVSSALSTNASQYIIVGGQSTPTANWLSLSNAYYVTAAAATPNGSALATTNRYSIFLLPGVYGLGTNRLAMSTDFVDVIGLSQNTGQNRELNLSSVYTFGDTILAGSDIVLSTPNTISANQDDKQVANLMLWSTGGVTFSPGTQGTGDRWQMNNVLILRDIDSQPATADVIYKGWFYNVRCYNDYAFGSGVTGSPYGHWTLCHGGRYAWSGYNGISDGKFDYCTGGESSFGNTGAAGTYVFCHARGSGFGSSGVFSGYAFACDATTTGFGAAGSLSGTLINCTAPGNWAASPVTGTIVDCNLGGINLNNGTGASSVPSGTTAQRPGSPVNGYVRYNTTTSRMEFYSGGAWRNHVRLDGDTMTGALTDTNAVLVTPSISGGSLSGITTNTSTFSGVFTNTGAMGISGASTLGGIVTVPDGSSTAPSIGFASNPNLGWYRSAANTIGLASANTSVFTTDGASYNFLSGNTKLIIATDTIMMREGAAIWQLGSDATAQNTPVNYTLKGADALAGTGTNIQGGDLTIATGRPTGTGTLPTLHLQTPNNAASGTTAGTLGDGAKLTGGNQRQLQVQTGTNATFVPCGGTLKVDTTTTGNVGGGEDTLITYTIPASVLAANGDHLEFDTWGSFAANANTKDLKVYYGATVLYDSTALIFNGVSWRCHGKVVRTGAATQTATAEFTIGGTLLGAVTTTTATTTAPAETLSGTVVFKATGTDSGGVPVDNSIVQNAMVLHWFGAN